MSAAPARLLAAGLIPSLLLLTGFDPPAVAQKPAVVPEDVS